MSFVRPATVIAATFLLAGTAPAVLAQVAVPSSAADAGRPLAPVVVTATRLPVRADAQLSDVTVLTREDLERAQGRTLAEVLAQQPGVQVFANGGRGKSAAVSIRGNDSRHTLLLVDGMRYGSATLGLASFENLPLEAIERIEIVRGPMSSLYGADAAGGVIQVFTRSGRQGLTPRAMLGAGSDGLREASAGMDAGAGDWSGSVQVAHLRDDGFSATTPAEPFGSFNDDDDPFRQTSANASVAWRFVPGWQLKANALQSRGRADLDDGPGARAQARLTSQTAGLELGGALRPGWRTTVRLSQTRDVYETLSSASPWTELGAIRTTQRQLSWEHGVDTPVGTVLALVERLEQSVRKPGADYETTERHIDALGLGLNGHRGIHHWQLSARHDRNSQFGHENTGNLAYGIDLAPAWRLGASVGRSFVVPSFNLLYWPGFGNPGLLPERGRSQEASLRWRPGEAHQLTLTAFRQRLRDFITADNRNAPQARIDGATLAYEGRAGQWRWQAAYDHLGHRDDGEGQTLLRRARHALKVGADHDTGPWLAGFTVTAQSARTDVAYDENFTPTTVDLPRYALLDLRADWRLSRQWTLQARLNNATDRRYETALGYRQPGREGVLALRWSGV